MSSQQHLTLPSLEHWRVSCYTKLNIQATIQDHFCLITTGPSDPRQGPDGLDCWWHWPLSPAAQLANYHPPTRQETARPAINTAACNLLPASCCFISAPPLRAAGGSSGDGQIKIGVSDMPSHPLQSGAATRFPPSPSRPPEECGASQAWQTLKGPQRCCQENPRSTGVGAGRRVSFATEIVHFKGGSSPTNACL